ncbi:MAG: EAL domain-containing protein [Acidaminobacteraceae bacterium]
MRKITMRKKLIISIFIGCLIPYFLGVMYLKSYIEKGLFENSVHNTTEMLNQVNLLIDYSFIRDVNEEVSLLSLLDFVKNSNGTLNNYSNYEDINFLYSKNATESSVNDYFKLFKTTHRFVNFTFLGTKDGGYTEYPNFIPSKNYDPTTRPWYTSTYGKDDINISEPYVTNMTNEMIVSFTKSVVNNEEHIGVIGISVSLDDLTKHVENIKIGNSGYILLLTKSNKFIVNSENPEWVLKTPEEVGLDVLSSINLNSNDYFLGEINGVTRVFSVITSKTSGWKIVAVIDESEILNNSKRITNILMFIYFITLLIIFIIVYTVSSEITQPLLGITNIIKKMSNFDFSDHKEIEKYANTTFEIETIANALDEMHDNFSEMMNQLSQVDKEIKHVDIEKNGIFKLELSENNPFNDIGISINLLLGKIYYSFEQLKASNHMVLEKNNLLTSSEEELLAQLIEIEKQRNYIEFLALHDPLTSLPNRRKFTEILTKKINSNQSGAVVLLDLDNFKGINDTLGHVFGDKVLQTIAKRLESIAHDGIFVSRFGGDEFLILLDSNERGKLDDLARLINEMFNTKFIVENNEIEITSSMGISLFPSDSKDVNQLIMNADLALYSVKNLSKNGYKYFDETMKEHLLKKSYIEVILREALENDGFKLVYQAQVSLKDGSIYGYEALIRLKNHQVSPSDFIGIAEEIGLIIQIGRIVTEKAIKQLSIWKANDIDLKPIAINFSANQIHDHNYIDFLKYLLNKYNVDGKYIEIEITESIFLENRDPTLSFLKELRNIGIQIAIDDFGTGYSSLSYLTFLPVDKIKLDKSLNDRFLELENIKVMDSLIALAHSLNLIVVAEGIELIDQVKRLKVGKCDYIQGYYFSRPLEPSLITREFTLTKFKI